MGSDFQIQLIRLMVMAPGYPTLWISLLLMTVAFVYCEGSRTNVPKIPGLPMAPGSRPFTGHLSYLGGRRKENDATVFSRWARQLSTPIFQLRLGSRRAVVLNDFASVKGVFLGHSNALINRPPQPGFSDMLGLDPTGSPMTESVRRCRQAIMRALGKPKWPGYYTTLEPTSRALIAKAYRRGENGVQPVDIWHPLVSIMFDLAMALTYGARLSDLDDEFSSTFLEALNTITAIRNTTRYYRHYVPLLRMWPESGSEIKRADRVRRARVKYLYELYQKRVSERGEVVNCVIQSLGADKLTDEEIHASCMAVLQAAPETVAGGVYQAVGWLCSPDGFEYQGRALAEILDFYGGSRDKAWNEAFKDDVPIIASLTKETLRYFPPSPFGLPRETVSDVPLKFAQTEWKIPGEVTVYMNTQEANLDESWYGADAKVFKPDRFLGDDSSLPHLAFGAGSRICPAMAIGNRITNALLVRLLLAFEMRQAQDGTAPKPSLDWKDWSDMHDSLVTIPRSFGCYFVARDPRWLNSILGDSGITASML
ncbi:cytochrome P450 [Exophiala viscosa]|uniref:cytochrome P450 n=1 Tax=Exophiala viscosa TaxID=2486360 RepID=UPI002192E387|nr:cytochrome P450 [Exophiala viscosa]